MAQIGPQSAALVTYTTKRSFETTLGCVRKALCGHGLCVTSEIDVTRRLRNDLGVGIYPCHTLLVDDPALLLEAIVFHRGAAQFFPQPVTVAAGDHGSHIYVRGLGTAPAPGLPASIRGPLQQLHHRIRLALDEVADREDDPQAVAS